MYIYNNANNAVSQRSQSLVHEEFSLKINTG